MLRLLAAPPDVEVGAVTAPPTPGALHPYHVTCAGLQYIAMATSASAAILSAIDLHGVHSASARRLA